MASFNKVILCGNLTRDVEMRYTPKGTAVAKVGLAVNRTWTDGDGQKKEEVTFVDIDFFGRTAEVVAQYMKKGGSILVEGRLKMSEWNDKTTGQKRSKLGIAGETVQFLGGKGEGESAPARAPASAPPTASKPPVAGDGPMEDGDSPIPF